MEARTSWSLGVCGDRGSQQLETLSSKVVKQRVSGTSRRWGPPLSYKLAEVPCEQRPRWTPMVEPPCAGRDLRGFAEALLGCLPISSLWLLRFDYSTLVLLQCLPSAPRLPCQLWMPPTNLQEANRMQKRCCLWLAVSEALSLSPLFPYYIYL